MDSIENVRSHCHRMSRSFFLKNRLECENHHNFYESTACQNMYDFTLHLQQCYFFLFSYSSFIIGNKRRVRARVSWMIFNRKIFWAICWNDGLIFPFISYNSGRKREGGKGDENQPNTHIISCDNRNENRCHSNRIWSDEKNHRWSRAIQFVTFWQASFRCSFCKRLIQYSFSPNLRDWINKHFIFIFFCWFFFLFAASSSVHSLSVYLILYCCQCVTPNRWSEIWNVHCLPDPHKLKDRLTFTIKNSKLLRITQLNVRRGKMMSQ